MKTNDEIRTYLMLLFPALTEEADRDYSLPQFLRVIANRLEAAYGVDFKLVSTKEASARFVRNKPLA